MKKVSMILIAVAFAATGISAGKPNPAVKECLKKADEALKTAQTANKDAAKECRTKKGQEKKDCLKSAGEALTAANKAKTESYKSCKAQPAAPAASKPAP